MVDLEQALSEHHLLVLRVIGEWWELDVERLDKAQCAAVIARKLRTINLPQELAFMQQEEAAALRALAAAGGRLPVAVFSREHGDVRQMGPARLEREEPWLDPASPAEALWYCGLLYRRFDETEEGLVEFFYLPLELQQQLGGAAQPPAQPTVVREAPPSAAATLRPSAPQSAATAEPDWWVAAPAETTPAETTAVDDLATLLAFAQRGGLIEGDASAVEAWLLDPTPARAALLVTLARELGLLRRSEGRLIPARPAVAWLEGGREVQLRALAEAWSGSGWNELRHVPTLRCEGSSWENDPLTARAALLDLLPRRPDWFSVAGFCAHLKRVNPDFQRPDGNYDTWYIRDTADNRFLRGFESWDQVEGRLVAYTFHGPLHWLGLVELGEGAARLTERAVDWLRDAPPPAPETMLPLLVQPDASILAPLQASRYARFQIMRVAEPDPVQPGKPYVYRLTPRALQAATEQGIVPQRVLQFLSEAGGNRPLPPGLQRAVERWAERGAEARLQQVVVLRVQAAEVLDKLRQNPKTRPFIGESLGDLAAVVRREDYRKLQQLAAQLGLLIDAE